MQGPVEETSKAARDPQGDNNNTTKQ